MTDKELIKQEIERRIAFQKECIKNSYRLTGRPEEQIILEYKQFLSYVDSLPEEPVSEDLEDAAVKYSVTDINGYDKEALYTGFKEGANWQKSRLL